MTLAEPTVKLTVWVNFNFLIITYFIGYKEKTKKKLGDLKEINKDYLKVSHPKSYLILIKNSENSIKSSQ